MPVDRLLIFFWEKGKHERVFLFFVVLVDGSLSGFLQGVVWYDFLKVTLGTT
jgi:hypothetical protein